jgi:hypothetical protein
MLQQMDAITNEVLEPITFILAYPTVLWSHSSTVTRLQAGWSRIQIRAEARHLTLLRNVHIASSVHPASQSMGTGSSFPQHKAAKPRMSSYPI